MPRARMIKDGLGRDYAIEFYCEGCERRHLVPVKGGPRPDAGRGWKWNASLSMPTLDPSVLVHEVKLEDRVRQPRCHSTITDGTILYHTDSLHAFAGRTVDLREIETAPDPF